MLALLCPATYGRKVGYLCAIGKEVSDETNLSTIFVFMVVSARYYVVRYTIHAK